MKKTFICCVSCLCIALTGCALIEKEYIPLSTYLPASKMYADTMGLMEAFAEHEELRALFIQATNGSIPLADAAKASEYTYDYYDDGTKAYYGYDKGSPFTDDSLRVDEETAEAISKIEELLPGVDVWMRMVEDRMCVVFSIVKNTTGEDDGYYDEQLFYSSYNLSDIKQYGYTEIGDGWWFSSGPMP